MRSIYYIQLLYNIYYILYNLYHLRNFIRNKIPSLHLTIMPAKLLNYNSYTNKELFKVKSAQ